MVGHYPCFGLDPPIVYIDHHDLDPLNPNLQRFGGVLFGRTRGTNLNLLYFA